MHELLESLERYKKLNRKQDAHGHVYPVLVVQIELATYNIFIYLRLSIQLILSQ